MAQGSRGKIQVYNDFTAAGGITTGVPDALYNNLGGGVGLIGVNEGVLALTIDEPGGVLSITTDTADNDNHALVAGAFRPSDGGMWMEVRMKMASVAATKQAHFIGFSETLSHATPVMPAETATGLEARGHKLTRTKWPSFDFGSSQIIWRFPEGGPYLGASESRRDGAAVGF